MNLVKVIVLAAVVGVAVTLVATLLGGVLVALQVSIAVVLGGFLVKFAGVLGVLAALWYFATHWS